MEGEQGEWLRLSKRFSSETSKSGEVDYKAKAGTAWSHSYLNQKPWHPLSYPNQRRKWIAEQTHASRLRRSEEVAREYAQEQEKEERLENLGFFLFWKETRSGFGEKEESSRCWR